VLQYFVRHKEEMLWAAVFAVIFALISDALGVGSRLREAVRETKNRMSERSILLLKTRIRQLQDYQKNLGSDRWVYLFAFQCIFLSLVALSCGALVWIFSISQGVLIYPRLAMNLTGISLACFATGGSFAAAGFRHVSHDTREKIDALIQKIGLEIEGLQKKLNDRSPAGGRLDA
jgi:hypothetical protein